MFSYFFAIPSHHAAFATTIFCNMKPMKKQMLTLKKFKALL
jgi:hypothetical protein